MGVVIVLLTVQVARADDIDPEQIKAALHTTNDIEHGFVDGTVAMVHAKTLPRDIFTSCFIWARKKPRYQIQYFKQALTLRAAEIGIDLKDDTIDPVFIKAALHTSSDIERGFVDRTVGMVQAGTLPRNLFTSCVIAAREKPSYQFQYFKQALTLRAAKIGINL